MERIAGIFTLKIGSKPLGIWISWLGMAYAAATFAHKLFALTDLATVGRQALAEAIATWAILAAAIIALARRRLLSRMLVGMAMTLLFFHGLFWGDRLGMAIALLVLPSLIANRRWFDEKLPKLGW